MKKIILSLLVTMIIIPVSGQTEHMKFAGIPLTGSIDQFQQKLMAKDYVPNTFINKHLPKGTRAFSGTFIGKKAEVAIYYDKTSKEVYGAKAYFEDLTEEKAIDEFGYLKNLLKQKYDDGIYEDGEHNGFKSITIYTDLGYIFVYINKNENLHGYPYHFSVHLEYYDTINGKKHNRSVLDDL